MARGRLSSFLLVLEFRSSVPEVSAAAATDMFMTALVKSGAFAVAERERLNEGVMVEKELNAQGQTTGDAANQQLAGAAYIFEGTVSEANTGESKTGVGGTVKGLGVETSGEKAVIELAAQLDLSCHECDLDPYDVMTADEAFFTATSFSIMPVTRFNGHPINSGGPGPITKRLIAAWSKMVGVDIMAQAKEYARAAHAG